MRLPGEQTLTVLQRSAIEGAVSERYGGLASSCCSLSCGSALDLAEAKVGEVLVDLGSGRGQDVIRAAGRVGPSGEAVGIDSTEAMLAHARTAVPPFLRNVRFVRSDLEKLELADACADVVVSNCTINHARDKAAVYREIFRVLKPGGRFVVSDIVAERELPESVRAAPAAWAGCYGGAIPEGEYLAEVRVGGFAEPQVLSRSEPYEKQGVLLRSLTLRATKTESSRRSPGPAVMNPKPPGVRSSR
ncbi:MAG: methyltransferase domain-containing protein [Myxococcaceae bacterium]